MTRLVKSRLYIAFVIACSGAPPRETPPAPVRDASLPDAAVASEPDAGLLTCDSYDPKNPVCAGSYRACLEGYADCKCQDPPDVENPACWAVMPCPRVPDKRVRACRPAFPACPDIDRPDTNNPNCPPPVVVARVISVKIEGAKTLVTVAVGSSTISKNWKATLLRGDSDIAVPGDLPIVRITPRMTILEVLVQFDSLGSNFRVRFVPP